MKAPGFWLEPPGLAARALQPFGAVYGAAAAWRMSRPGLDPGVPVICAGNFTAGGAGKTPAALLIASILKEQGRRPVFLTRGYGGAEHGPRLVDPARDVAAAVGDEALLLARAAPAVVSRRRAAGAKFGVSHGADVIVMDDGLQNPSLKQTLSIAVVDGETGLGNGLCIPAGPLRAPMPAQWPRIQAALIVGGGAAGARIAADAAARGKAVISGRLEPDASAAASLRGKRVLAFAGIGRPEKFFATLAGCGAEIAQRRAYADHAPLADSEAEALLAAAAAEELRLVTTEKDFVRLGASPAHAALRAAVFALPVAMAVDGRAALAALIAVAMNRG